MQAKSLLPQPDGTDALSVFDVCHREILAHLDTLKGLVSELSGDPDELARSQARNLIAFFAGPAREHNDDEERHLFPTLLQCNDSELKRAAETVCEDHAWIELYWLDIEPQLRALADGGSTLDRRALRCAVEVFDTVVRDHIALEESVLYPQLCDRLKLTADRSISCEVAARREAISNPSQPD